MNFKAHISGGIVVGSLIMATATVLTTPTAATLLQIFFITVFFSIFPDLDISSIPQRWFYRALFIVLGGLAYFAYYKIATILAMLAITPVMSQHRGWTHSYIAAILTPVVLAIFYEYLLIQSLPTKAHNFVNIQNHLKQHIWLVTACISGWCIHLFLDNKYPKFSN